jgi:DNA-binding transcriptional MocR family regulator
VLLTLDSSLHKPLYLQIRDQIRDRIMMGAVKGGDRLEPSRELAKRLGVHRTTVANAYAELEAEGFIEGSVGRGTFVSLLVNRLRESSHSARRPSNEFFWQTFFTDQAGDDALARLMASSSKPGMISFSASHAASELAPLDVVRRATDVVLRREGSSLLQYGPTDGYPPLKKYLQSGLRRDGINLELDEILITSGCQQSLDLVRRALVNPGDTMVCENPTYTGLWHVFDTPDVRLVGVSVGQDGIDLDLLQALLEQNKVRLILTSPNFHNPTGRTMPLAARRRLLELSAAFRVPVVEDDVYGALRYQGRELPPLKALDTSGMVIHLNSFSKIGFPGFRVGWVLASPRVIQRLRTAKQRADLHTNVLAQAVLEELGRTGSLDKLVRRSRKMYEHKLGVLRRALDQQFPVEAKWNAPEGGMSIWVEFPSGVSATELLVKAQDRGVSFAPARYFYFQAPRDNAMRLCFSAVSDQQIERGISILGDLLKREIHKAANGSKRPVEASSVALV